MNYKATVWVMLMASVFTVTTCSKQVPKHGGDPGVGVASSTDEPQLAALPDFPTGALDTPGSRAVSAVDNYQFGNSYLSASPAGATVNGTALEMDSAGNEMAWALYQWSGIGSGDQLLQIGAELSFDVGQTGWLVLSNFASGRWESIGPVNSSLFNLDYTAGADYVSPAGNTYAGVLVANGNSVTVNRVNLRIEPAGGGTILLTEPFEDENYASRGWYDSPGFGLTTAEHAPGASTSAVEFQFAQGATKPTVGGGRVQFTETDSVYVSFWVKYSANWTGSNRPYHPHEFHFVTNENTQYVGPAYTHLTTYIEHNEGIPLLAIQDADNIDESNIDVDLSAVTENRGVAGCNGSTDGYPDDCYLSGSLHRNGKQWKADGVYFSDAAGPYYKNDWHFIEAYFKLNSIVDGKGITDGVVRYWYDGQLLIDHSDVLLRTGQHPNMMFNQFLVLPYIGDGSPIAQTMWLDNLTIATGRP